MTYITDHLARLTCAARSAKDLGYLNTGRVFEQLIIEEQERLKLFSEECSANTVEPTPCYDHSDT